MSEPTIGVLYCVHSKTSGKSYIGITFKGIKRRWSDHVSDARRGTGAALSRAIRKYGASDFVVTVLAVAENREYLCACEMRAIAVFNTKRPAGYNLTAGGDGAWELDSDARERNRQGLLAAWQRPDVRASRIAGYRAWRATNVLEWSDEGRAAISAATTKHWAENREARSRAIKEGLNRPEVKARHLAALRRNASDPEIRKKRSENATRTQASPEYRQRMSAAVSAAKQRKKCQNPQQ